MPGPEAAMDRATRRAPDSCAQPPTSQLSAELARARAIDLALIAEHDSVGSLGASAGDVALEHVLGDALRSRVSGSPYPPPPQQYEMIVSPVWSTTRAQLGNSTSAPTCRVDTASPASHPDRRGRPRGCGCAVARVHHLERRANRAVLDIGRRRAALASGTLGVGQQGLDPTSSGNELVELDAVAPEHPGVADSREQEVAIGDRRCTPAGHGGEHDLVDERRAAPGSTPEMTPQAGGWAGRSRPCRTVAERGHRLVDRVRHPVGDVRGRNGTARRMARDPDDAVLSQVDAQPPEEPAFVGTS